MRLGGTRQISWQEIISRAEARQIHPREIEKSFLQEGIIPVHYMRNMNAISPAEQLILLEARVGVCGCGGLGLHIMNHLARMGVGHLSVWDPDSFSESNLNRQLFAGYGNLGRGKVEVCRQHIQQINPAVTVTARKSLWEADRESLFTQQEVIADALDSIKPRLDLAQACAEAEIPLVHGAVAGWYGQVTVIMPGDDSLQILYRSSAGAGIEQELGTLSFTPAVIASLQAAEVIKLLLGKETNLADEICMVDLLDFSIENIKKCDIGATIM